MSVYSKHADSLRAVQAQLGTDCPQLFFNGQLINILPRGVKLKRTLESGGYNLDSDIQLTCLAADFSALPTSKQTFTYPGQAGNKFKIDSVTPAAGGYQLRINADHADL